MACSVCLVKVCLTLQVWWHGETPGDSGGDIVTTTSWTTHSHQSSLSALHCWPQSTQLSLFYWQGRAGLGRANLTRNNLRDSELLSSPEQLHMSYSFYFLNLFVSSEDDDICSLKHKYSIFIIHIQLHKFWRYHGIVGWLLGNINKLILWPKNWMNSVDYFR